MNNVSLIFLLIISMMGCTSRESAFTTGNFFESGVSLGTIKGKEIREASGLVESINNTGKLWTHNDSGNDPEIFLIDKTGKKVAIVHISNVNNRDWEDITIGPGPETGKNYLYIGEIGDNNAVHEYKYIYRFEEPVLSTVSDTTITQIDVIKFKLQDGPRDTESLMIDPTSRDLYIFSKREEKINLYKISYPQSTTDLITAELVLSKLPFTQIVAADMSKDGSEVLIKNYNKIYYWKKESNEPLESLLKKSPAVLPYEPEPQGESIAFDRNGSGFYTLSEQKKKMPQHLFFYKRR